MSKPLTGKLNREYPGRNKIRLVLWNGPKRVRFVDLLDWEILVSFGLDSDWFASRMACCKSSDIDRDDASVAAVVVADEVPNNSK